jgi:hypothetical protein
MLANSVTLWALSAVTSTLADHTPIPAPVSACAMSSSVRAADGEEAAAAAAEAEAEEAAEGGMAASDARGWRAPSGGSGMMVRCFHKSTCPHTRMHTHVCAHAYIHTNACMLAQVRLPTRDATPAELACHARCSCIHTYPFMYTRMCMHGHRAHAYDR